MAAIFTSLNKKIVDNAPPPPLVMSLTELFAAFVVCTAVAPLVRWNDPGISFLPQTQDWLWLGILAWVCTLLPYYLTLRAMRHISAFATNLTINLEPVYGVALAAFIFREDKDLNPGFYIGVFIILIAVFGHPFLKKMFEGGSWGSRE